MPFALFEKLASSFAESFTKLERRPRSAKNLACPHCKILMNVIDVGLVEIDQCVDHGIWFDAAELSGALTALFEQNR